MIRVSGISEVSGYKVEARSFFYLGEHVLRVPGICEASGGRQMICYRVKSITMLSDVHYNISGTSNNTTTL